MKSTVFTRLLRLLNDLERNKIHYTLGRYREEAIMVLVTVPGERWEIEFLNDGTLEIERFSSSGDIQGEEALAELFELYGEPGCDDGETEPATELEPRPQVLSAEA
jgi:hypothetical protein